MSKFKDESYDYELYDKKRREQERRNRARRKDKQRNDYINEWNITEEEQWQGERQKKTSKK